ncbi:hypothetical protein CLOM_g15396 [Closterium sp. NIES-68]|nr:hypothetical protein CLOM_g15396 [Closterium sp. NIES-68]GJP65676.1 hypothetical protein CLOP_g22542 [Closterium sp. NIES-67]
MWTPAAPAAAAAVFLPPCIAAHSPRNIGGRTGERGACSASRCGCHQQRSCRDRRHARLLVARTRAEVNARAAFRPASPPPASPAASAGRVHAAVAAGPAVTAEPQSAASAALPAVVTPTFLPRGMEQDKGDSPPTIRLDKLADGSAQTGGELADGARKAMKEASRQEAVASAAEERAECVVAGRPMGRRTATGPVILQAAEVQRDGSVILRFSPLPARPAPATRAPRAAAATAAEDEMGRGDKALRSGRGGEGGARAEARGEGEGEREVRADAGVVVYLTACTSEHSRAVPDAVIEEIVGLPLRLTPVDHVAQWVALTAHHTIAAISDAIRLPASALRLHRPALPSLPQLLGRAKPLLPSPPSASPSMLHAGANIPDAVVTPNASEEQRSPHASDSLLHTLSPSAPTQQQPAPHTVLPQNGNTQLPATTPAQRLPSSSPSAVPPSPAASLAVTAVGGVVLAGLVQFLASLTGLVGRMPGSSSGTGQSRLLWNLPAATVLLLVAAVKVWVSWWPHSHRKHSVEVVGGNGL